MSLDIQHTVRKLQTYSGTRFPILSVYLEIPPSNDTTFLIDEFTHLIDTSLTAKQKKMFANDITYTTGFLENYQNTNNDHSLAIFSGDDQLWEVVHTHFRIKPVVKVGHKAYLKPLIEHINEYQRYLVVLADREKAKFFTLFLGTVEAQGEVFDPSVPNKVKGRDFATKAGKIDRHIQDHLHRHFKLISEKVNDFAQNKYINGVIVGGHKELIHNFEHHLPKNLKDKIIGEFVSELNVSINVIIERSKSIVSRVNRNYFIPQNTQFT